MPYMKNILQYLLIASISTVLFSCEKVESKKEEPTIAKDSTDTPCCQVDSLKRDLILYLPFNNSANDESGKKNNGKMYDMSSIPDRNGKLNSAFYFNGVSSFITIEDNENLRLNNTDFTINYWVSLGEFYP
ncbi:MAG: 5-Nucleotidase domain protein [Daejeonella sp.]|nr:5-Nucleotidase domain protein [Daejeonella sp.]